MTMRKCFASSVFAALFAAFCAAGPAAPEPVCVDGICYFPGGGTVPESAAASVGAAAYPGVETCRIVRSVAGYMDAERYIAFLSDDPVAAEAADAVARARRRGGRLVLVLALLGAGALLNLSPCVLPLVPVFLAMLGAGGAAVAKKRRGGIVAGAAFGSGMAVAFGALGVAAARGGRAFGAWQGSWVFHAVVAAAFAVFALASLDVFTIDFSRFRPRMASPRAAKRSGLGALTRAFALGSLSAALGGACTAPALASALVLAAEMSARGDAAGSFVPLLVGIGMGAPWPLLGAGVAVLPKPGAWMRRVRPVYAALFAALAAWQIVAAVRTGRPAVAYDAAAGGGANGGIEWLRDERAAIAAASATGAPILLDLVADWCAECRRMERNTFSAAAVVAAVEESGAVALRLDCTNAGDPEVARVLRAVGAPGLPFTALLEAPGGAYSSAMPK